MPINRREIFSIVPGALFLGALIPKWSAGEAVLTGSEPATLPSAVFLYEKLPVETSPKVETRPILKGKLETGELMEVHETTLPAGGAPHGAHRHVHSEMWLVREGTIEITIEGKAQRLGGGSLAFVRSNELHGVTNPTDKPANYFVVAVGPDAGK